MSRTSLTHLWKLTKPYWIIGRIAVLVLGSLAYLHFVEGFRKFSKDSKALEETGSNGVKPSRSL
jgi:hypothetical protein